MWQLSVTSAEPGSHSSGVLPCSVSTWHKDLSVMESTAPWHMWFSCCGTFPPYWLYWIILNSLFKMLTKAWNTTACWLLHETHVCSFCVLCRTGMKKETNTRREGHLSKTVGKKNPNTLYEKKCSRKMKKFHSPTHLGGFYQFNFFPFTENLTVAF